MEASELYLCHNLAEFLARFRAGRNSKRNTSIRELSRRLQYSSDRTLGMIYSGKRAMSEDMIERISTYLKFSHREEKFLRLLVKQEESSKKKNSKKDYETELAKLRKAACQYQVLDEGDLSHFERWIHTPLLELVHALGPTASTQTLQHCLEGSPSLEDVKQSLMTLKKMGLIDMAPNTDIWYSTMKKRYFRTPYDIPSSAIRNAHRQMLARASEALDEQSTLDREFLTKAFLIRSDKIGEAKRRIREIVEELTDEIIDSPGLSNNLEVYQLSVQFFRQGRVSS